MDQPHTMPDAVATGLQAVYGADDARAALNAYPTEHPRTRDAVKMAIAAELIEHGFSGARQAAAAALNGKAEPEFTERRLRDMIDDPMLQVAPEMVVPNLASAAPWRTLRCLTWRGGSRRPWEIGRSRELRPATRRAYHLRARQVLF